MRKRHFPAILTFLILLFYTSLGFGQSKGLTLSPLNKLDTHSPWVNHTFRRLSRKQRIEQIFMVAAYSNKSLEYSDSIGKIIKKYQPGGIIFFQGGPYRQTLLLNSYQKSLKVPAMVAMDAEWGPAMRLDSTLAFPYQMTLGALTKDTLIRKMGEAIGFQLSRLGVQVNFAPVLDVNNNIHNTVINFRSFGENKESVSEKANQYILGLQDKGILATGKHFPGHGDTEVDSHSDLPSLPFNRARLDSLELYPFRKAIALGIGGMMVAHMHIQAYDTSIHLPSSLSGNVIEGLLRTRLGFKGLIFTDAMNMKGVIKYYPPGQAELMAVQAGNDMVEMSTDLEGSVRSIRKALRKGLLSREVLNEKCRNILAWKEWMGLNAYKPVSPNNLYADLHKKEDKELIQELSDESLTLVRWEDSSRLRLPHKIKNGIILAVNSPDSDYLRMGLSNNFGLRYVPIPANADSLFLENVLTNMGDFDAVFLCLHDKRLRPSASLNYSKPLLKWIGKLALDSRVYTTLLANPYCLAKIDQIEKASHLLITYQDSDFTERSALGFWSGSLDSRGKLPVSIPGKFLSGFGLINHFR